MRDGGHLRERAKEAGDAAADFEDTILPRLLLGCPPESESDVSIGSPMLSKGLSELNPMEQYWAPVKECLRRVYNYTFSELRINVPAAIRLVELHTCDGFDNVRSRFKLPN